MKLTFEQGKQCAQNCFLSSSMAICRVIWKNQPRGGNKRFLKAKLAPNIISGNFSMKRAKTFYGNENKKTAEYNKHFCSQARLQSNVFKMYMGFHYKMENYSVPLMHFILQTLKKENRFQRTNSKSHLFEKLCTHRIEIFKIVHLE